MTLGLPFRVIGGPRFYERQEIRDALAYLRVIAQPDDGLAFERIVNVPRRGIGAATLRVLHGLARAERISLVEAASRLIGTDELKPAARKALGRLIEDFDRWRALKTRVPHPELVETVLDESGYTGMWQADRSPEAPGRLDNLKELVRAMADFESLDGFLEHVALVMENDQAATGERVSIMTLHGAKGLEFDNVFLPGWEEGLFPNQRSLDESGNVGLEEERRLAHVGITRARQRVYISFAANRRIYNQWQSSLPSRFIDELPEDHIERDSELGLYGGSDAGPGMQSGTSFGGSTAASEWAMRRRNRQPPPVLEAEATAVDYGSTGARFQVGERVFHQKFGYGAIQAVEGSKLLIAFEKAGTKKVLDSFVERP
jgi:DNA helicase-2/ATP-dependent DNA helicase PcrA